MVHRDMQMMLAKKEKSMPFGDHNRSQDVSMMSMSWNSSNSFTHRHRRTPLADTDSGCYSRGATMHDAEKTFFTRSACQRHCQQSREHRGSMGSPLSVDCQTSWQFPRTDQLRLLTRRPGAVHWNGLSQLCAQCRNKLILCVAGQISCCGPCAPVSHVCVSRPTCHTRLTLLYQHISVCRSGTLHSSILVDQK